MDLEQLNKHQIILLTLLVSFMTSIATGIVTVSLMNQAPPQISRTINQVVEQTVEKVVPVASSSNMTIEKTVISNSDLVTQSIASARKGIIRITAHGGDTLIARGIIINANGTAITDRAALDASGATSFDAILSSGQRVSLSVPSAEGSSAVGVVTVTVGTSTGFAPVSLASVSTLNLGEGVIRISGIGDDTVDEGVIAMIPQNSSGSSPTMIEATVSSSIPGSVLLTLSGNIIGISTTASEAQGNTFYSVPSTGTSTTTPATHTSS